MVAANNDEKMCKVLHSHRRNTKMSQISLTDNDPVRHLSHKWRLGQKLPRSTQT
jgi:hypothetical protein